MKDTLLKYLIYIAGIICLYAFIAVRVLPLLNFALIENRHPDYFEFTKYGELYYFSQIKHFREELPFPKKKFRLSEENSPINEAEIIAFGDSFFDFNRQETVAERLQDTLNVNVHAVNAWYPLSYLERQNYKKQEEKIFIFEVVERNIHFRFNTRHTPERSLQPLHKPTGARAIVQNLKKNIFPENDEELYSVLLKGSYLTSSIYTSIATLKFDALGYISSRTPVYDLNQFDYPVLFYDLTVNDNHTSFYFEHTDDMIDAYCKNIEDLSNRLKSEYNLKMVFMPIPNKFTLYYKTISPYDEYDDFLPRLYKAMEKRNIQFVNIYNDFKTSDEQLYYGTDTHWNKHGVDIAVERLLQLFTENDSTFTQMKLSLSHKTNLINVNRKK